MPGEIPTEKFAARGNEPFWSVEVDGTVLVWKTPENQEGKILPATRSAHAGGVEFSGKDDDKDFTLDINDKPCHDSMSGQAFEFTATWTYAGESHQGCAERGK
ncbi:MAG TPA: hypothetical protein VGQ93_11925 [Lysobacter sp.]|nr:hypothetical protein [Lysobacter sp.]